MPTTSRFPLATATAASPSETDQIIQIFGPLATIYRGGGSMIDVSAWQRAGFQSETPYSDIVLEFKCDDASLPYTLGNGTTDQIGLYGSLPGEVISGTGPRYLLGVLGISLGNTMPQIPFVQSSLHGPPPLGMAYFAQVVCNVAQYGAIGIGAVSADIVTGGPLITVTARPIRKRVYGG